MTGSEELFSRVREAVEAKLAAASGCHDFDHTLRVLANAKMLAAELPEADAEIVALAAMLHDIARPEELASHGKLCHAAAGAGIAEKMLLDFGASPETARAVAEAVRTHRYRGGEKPRTLEAQIVYDADKLDSLGAVGLGRAFLFAGHCGARLHNTEAEALGSPAYSREDTAYREYLVKLRHLPGAMLTEPGRAEGARRLRFMRRFFERLDAEIRAAK